MAVVGNKTFFVYKNEIVVELLELIKTRYHFRNSIIAISSFEELVDSTIKDRCVLLDVDEINEDECQKIIKYLKTDEMNSQYIILKNNFDENEMRGYFKDGSIDCLKKPLSEECIFEMITFLNNRIPKSGSLQQIEYYQSSLKTSLAYDLIFGNVKNAKEIWERSQFAGLSLVPNIAMTVCIDDFYSLIKDKSKLWEQSIRDEIIHTINQDTTMNEIIAIVTSAEQIAVLLSIPVQSNLFKFQKKAVQCAEQIKQNIKQKTEYSVTVGIGNYYEDARNLHISYQESLIAQSYRLFLGKNQVIHINDIQNVNHDLIFLTGEKIELMAKKLMMGDVEGVKESLGIIVTEMSTKGYLNPKILKFQILDMLSLLSHSAIRSGVNSKEVLPIQMAYANELQQVETISQISLWMEDVVDCYLSQIFMQHNEQVLKAIQKSLKYIHEHYTEDINLEKVARHVFLSPNYFCTIFKEATGLSLIEFITNLRIEKSKTLLMQLDYTIYQIAEEVGYKTPRYFSRVFKSVTDMTPSQYRNSRLVTNVSVTKETS